MSGENLVKFLLGTLARVRDRALGVLGSGSPRSLLLVLGSVYCEKSTAELPPLGPFSGLFPL